MTPMDPEKIQKMTQGYETRIENQKQSINRLQVIIDDLEGRLRVETAGRGDAERLVAKLRQDLIAQKLEGDRKAAQLAAEAANLRTLLDAANAMSAPPDEPYNAPVEWDRRVPEGEHGPTPSGSDEVLPFDGFEKSAMPAGEVRPSPII